MALSQTQAQAHTGGRRHSLSLVAAPLDAADFSRIFVTAHCDRRRQWIIASKFHDVPAIAPLPADSELYFFFQMQINVFPLCLPSILLPLIAIAPSRSAGSIPSVELFLHRRANANLVVSCLHIVFFARMQSDVVHSTCRCIRFRFSMCRTGDTNTLSLNDVFIESESIMHLVFTSAYVSIVYSTQCSALCTVTGPNEMKKTEE